MANDLLGRWVSPLIFICRHDDDVQDMTVFSICFFDTSTCFS
jgi:hypothetical protein